MPLKPRACCSRPYYGGGETAHSDSASLLTHDPPWSRSIEISRCRLAAQS
jgi:hypothetical protein